MRWIGCLFCKTYLCICYYWQELEKIACLFFFEFVNFCSRRRKRKETGTLDRRLYWSHDSSLFFFSEIIARVHLYTGNVTWCRGDILQIDAQITFRAIGLPGLKRLSVDEIKNEDYVSQEKVVFDKLKKGETILYFRSLSFDQCVGIGLLLNYSRTSGLLELLVWKKKVHPTRPLFEVYYTKSSTGKYVNGIKAYIQMVGIRADKLLFVKNQQQL